MPLTLAYRIVCFLLPRIGIRDRGKLLTSGRKIDSSTIQCSPLSGEDHYTHPVIVYVASWSKGGEGCLPPVCAGGTNGWWPIHPNCVMEQTCRPT
jgi:hypothetical protein